MERGVITYIAAFLTGILIYGFINTYATIPLIIPLLFSISLFFLLLLKRGFFTGYKFLIITHIILFFTGVTHYGISARQQNQPHVDKTQKIRENLSQKLKSIAGEGKEYAVLAAITLGSKNELPRELKKAYSNSGAMHILALSGLHIGILYGIISFLLFFLDFSYKTKRFKFIISAIMILFYGYITGFSPSVQRAAIMILVYSIASMGSRRSNKYAMIAIAAFLITLVNPRQLFHIGFQLSFAAVIGIAAIYPVINGSFKILYPDHQLKNLSGYKYVKKGVSAVWSILAISVACQITTFPFTIYYFGTYAPYFLLTNLVAVPLAAVILYLFVPAIALSHIPVMGSIASEALVWTLSLLNTIIEFIG